MQSDAFDEILGLEEQFYSDGFQQGLQEGLNAGRIEGRTLGLEKGFEKYAESGKLYGKWLVWASRTPQIKEKPGHSGRASDQKTKDIDAETQDQHSPRSLTLPSLSFNQRLVKHLAVLRALSESRSLSIENTEEAVSDFDDRLRRAEGKAKIIERIVGEKVVLADGIADD